MAFVMVFLNGVLLSNTRIVGGLMDVRNDALDGPQLASCAYARENRTPRAASLSILGVDDQSTPYEPRFGLRSSDTMNRMFLPKGRDLDDPVGIGSGAPTPVRIVHTSPSTAANNSSFIKSSPISIYLQGYFLLPLL